MTPRIPALNEVRAQTESQPPKFPKNAEELRYLILYPDDYEGHGVDVEGNVALLVNEDHAREIKRLAENIIQQLDDNTDDMGRCPTCGASSFQIEKRDGQYYCSACGCELDGADNA